MIQSNIISVFGFRSMLGIINDHDLQFCITNFILLTNMKSYKEHLKYIYIYRNVISSKADIILVAKFFSYM